MQDKEEDKSVKREKREELKSRNIVSPGVIAFGRMAQASWAIVLGGTALLTAIVMAFTKTEIKEGWRSRDKVLTGLKWPVEATKRQFSQSSFSSYKDKDWFKGIFVVVTAAATISTVAKHIFQAVFLRKGYKEAQRINERYQEVVDERDTLLDKLAKYEGESYAESRQANSQNTTAPVSQETTPQITAQKQATAPVAIPPLSPPPNAAPPMTDMNGPHAMPPGYFADGQKPMQTHAGSVQDRKDSLPLMGAGV